MPRSTPSVFSRRHAFGPTELDAADRKMPPGWTLDRSACECVMVSGQRGWEATLALVGPEGRSMRCASLLHVSPEDARADALASVAEAAQMILAMAQLEAGRRQTALVVPRPELSTLRPSQVLSLRVGSPAHR